MGLLLIGCAGLVYVGLAASFIRTSEYWPWTKMAPSERSWRARRLGRAAPLWVGVAWICATCGAFVISDSNWVGVAVVGFCGLTQVALATQSQRQARRRAARAQERHFAAYDLPPDSPYWAARSRHDDGLGRQRPERGWER